MMMKGKRKVFRRPRVGRIALTGRNAGGNARHYGFWGVCCQKIPQHSGVPDAGCVFQSES